MNSKRLLSLVVLSLLAGSGCSSLSKSFGSKDSLVSDENYRVTQEALMSPLELPPGFQNPNRNMTPANLQLMGQLNNRLALQDIPTYRVDGISIRSNLSERWLHIDKVKSDDMWDRLQRFLVAQGFSVEEARKDIGLIRTNFAPRNDVVPKAEIGFLTRVLNSWRAETAKGALDRLTVRVQTTAGGMDVYFRHSMLVEDMDGESRNWRSRPYHPEFEAEMLYQSMVFLGATTQSAQRQVAAQVKTLESSLDGEFAGLTLQAGYEDTWQHVLSLSDRAGFSILQSDKANGVLLVQMPTASTESEKGFWSRLFGDSGQSSQLVSLKLKSNQGQTDLFVSGDKDQMLTSEQKKMVLKRMGILE